MAPLTGDVVVRCGRQSWRLRLDMNAMCSFEAMTGLAALPWLARFEAGRIDKSAEMRAMVWAAMLRHHPEATPEEAGDLVDAQPDVLMKVIGSAIPNDAQRRSGAVPGKKLRLMSGSMRFFGRIARLAWNRRHSGI